MPTAQIAGEALAAWASLIDDAVQAGLLPALLRAASERAPGDRGLAIAADEADEGRVRVPQRGRAHVVFFGLGAAALVAGAVVFALAGPERVGSSQAAPSAVTGDVDPAGADAAEIAPAAEVQEPTPQGASPAAEAPEPDGAPAEPATGDPEPRATTSASSDPAACTGPGGQVIGYTFAGMSAPPAANGEWRMSMARNVRQSFPNRENGYDARSEVVCVIPEGARLRLDRDPVRVEGGAWWLPMVAGSVSEP